MENLVKTRHSESSVYGLNELYNEGKIYLMDNHLAASWCWAKKLDFQKKYNLFHIDKHYDLLVGGTDLSVSHLQSQNFSLIDSTIEEYIEISCELMRGQQSQIFRYDNYMTIFKKLHPEILKEMNFATHKDGTVPNDWNFYESEIYDLPRNLSFWINRTDEQWILNIDIDYFFDKNPDYEYYQFLTDEYVNYIADQITLCFDKIAVITIALSPTFCGGMEKSKRVAKIICDKIGFQFPSI